MREVTGVDGGTDLETGVRVELVDLVEDLVQGAHDTRLGSGEALAGVLQSGGERRRRRGGRRGMRIGGMKGEWREKKGGGYVGKRVREERRE